MRTAMLALTAVAAFVAAVTIQPRSAEAMMLPSQAVIADVAAHADHVQKVRRYCRNVCGRYGCRRQCWWAPRRYYRPYYRPYRPYYRPRRYY